MTDRDPVCGMSVDLATTPHTAEHGGRTYGFCCGHCRDTSLADPGRYLQPPAERTPALPAPAVPGATYVCPMDSEVREDRPGACPKCGMALEPEMPVVPAASVEYVCPMHLEVMRDEPGVCPKCGMALEPRVTEAEERPNAELIDMTRRFWVGAALGVPVFLLAMGEMVFGAGMVGVIGRGLGNWLQLAFATPVVLWAGWPFYERAWMSIVNASPNMFTLIGLGVGSAYLYSVAATVAPGLFPAGFQTATGVEPYFDTAVVIKVKSWYCRLLFGISR